jgi:type I restriction enzyme M protein
MWRRLSVKNYRSLADVTVDLAPFTLVVGPNGSGKSNLADVLVFVADLARDTARAIQRRGGIVGMRRWSAGKRREIEIELLAARTRAELDSSTIRYEGVIQSAGAGGWSFGRERVTAGSVEQVRPDTLRSDRSVLESRVASDLVRPLLEAKRVKPSPAAMRGPLLADEVIELTESGDNTAAAFQSLAEPEREQIERTMGRIVPGLRRITVAPFDRYLLLRFEQQQGDGKVATFSATEMSDGALRALAILTALAQITPEQLLVIEEPEVSIHAGAAQLLFEAMKAASEVGSVLVTTHSADLLDAARDEEMLVCRYADGVTRVGPLASEQRPVVRDGLFSLAELVRSDPLRIEGDEPTPVEL